jgi:hypothetical protein
MGNPAVTARYGFEEETFAKSCRRFVQDAELNVDALSKSSLA